MKKEGTCLSFFFQSQYTVSCESLVVLPEIKVLSCASIWHQPKIVRGVLQPFHVVQHDVGSVNLMAISDFDKCPELQQCGMGITDTLGFEVCFQQADCIRNGGRRRFEWGKIEIVPVGRNCICNSGETTAKADCQVAEGGT